MPAFSVRHEGPNFLVSIGRAVAKQLCLVWRHSFGHTPEPGLHVFLGRIAADVGFLPIGFIRHRRAPLTDDLSM